jgi:hypothetical protein
MALGNVEPKHDVVLTLWEKEGRRLGDMAAHLMKINDLENGEIFIIIFIIFNCCGFCHNPTLVVYIV